MILFTKISFFFALSIHILANPLFVQNTLKEIATCEDKVILELVRVWNDDEDEDENKFFRIPTDIKINKNGLIHIVDTSNHRIQVFDKSGNYVRTIGRMGKGPGDLLLPNAVAFDINNNIITADGGNYRIQALDPKGEYLFSFKTINGTPTGIGITRENEIAVYSDKMTRNTGSIITLYNYKGKIKQEIGKFHERINTTLKSEDIFFSMDKEDNIFIAYYATPIYCKYSHNGELLMLVNFDMGVGVKVHHDLSKNEFQRTGKTIGNTISALSIDKKDRIFLVASTRPPLEKERFFLVGNLSGTLRVAGKKTKSDNTDRYRLLVFNSSGKVIAAKKLNVFCDKIYIHDNTLFIIDSYMGMKIYEYKFRFL